MPVDEVEITEIEEFLPSRVDGVKSAANGFPILMLKSIDGEVTEAEGTIDDVLAELDKAEADAKDAKPKCDTCDGTGKIKGGNVKCPKCLGTGIMPKVGMSEKELADAAKEAGVAPSGAPVAVDPVCGHCKGSGKDATGMCDACGGTGKDADAPAPSELNTVDGDAGKVTVGAGGRETVDKSICDEADCDICEDVEKGTLNAKDRKALPDSAFALPGRQYPIHDAAHARNALARVAQNGTADEQSKVKSAVKAKYPDIDVDGDDASKAAGAVFSGPNAQITAAAQAGNTSPSDDDTDANTPGSPAWEAVDAQMATDAALALNAAAELIRSFAQRETQEVAAGEGNDVFDAYSAQAALGAVMQAIGVMTTMAFHEGIEAAKSLPDDEVVEKAGRRLAGKTVTALATARDKAKDLADHISGVLGADDPATKKSIDETDETTESVEIDMDALSKEIEDMQTDELTKVLDARDEKLVGSLTEALTGLFGQKKAKKGKAAMDEKASQSNAKDAKAGADAKDPKAEDDDLEDEADQGDSDSASSPAKGAAKAELTPEEIEAKQARKDAKKALRKAEQAEKDAADNAALTHAIEEATEEVRKSNAALQDRLDKVEKMAAPSTIVRTAPVDAQNVAKAKDELELRLATLERTARETNDHDIRKAAREEAKELRDQIGGLA